MMRLHQGAGSARLFSEPRGDRPPVTLPPPLPSPGRAQKPAKPTKPRKVEKRQRGRKG